MRIKAFGLALVAVAAMSMAAASLAQGAQLHATTQATNVVLTGAQSEQNKFQITPASGGPSVTCAQTTFDATTTPTAQIVTLTATYGGCQAFGQAAQVKMNDCDYSINGTTPLNPAQTAQVDVKCATGGSIEVVTAICTIKVGAQENISHIVFSNVAGSPHTAKGQITASAIKYTLSGVGCGHATGALTNDGVYTGAGHFQAYNDQGTDVTGHQATYTHNNTPLGLEVT